MASRTGTELIQKSKTIKCKVKGCQTRFDPRQPWQRACSPEHAIELVIADKLKKVAAAKRKEAQETKRRKDEIKSRAEHLDDCQKAANLVARLRDLKAGYGCISCGSTSSYPRWQGGHYLSVGAYPQNRFNLDNIHLQCLHCNMHKGGNASPYRSALIAKIGLERVEKLECNQEIPKWTIEEIIAMKKEFQRMAKELKKD